MKIINYLIWKLVTAEFARRKKTEVDGVRYIKLRKPKGRPEHSTAVLKKGSIHGKNALPLPVDILLERDVAVPLRDGQVMFTDILRPVSEAVVPAIVAWSPYGKNQPMQRAVNVPGLQLSNLQKFEGPDPAYWVPKGYAVVNPDIRGSGHSSGNLSFWGRQEGRDGFDLVEWIAAQKWSNGKVGFTGNSYLAIAQWFIAAEQPPHLSAIAPWEGFSDIYRHSLAPGGIPTPEFSTLVSLILAGVDPAENLPAMIEHHPMMNEFWRSKVANLSNITVPTYAVASYANKPHTRGTVHAFNGIASKGKWLRIHNTHEWEDYYRNQDDLLRFFDYFLVGVENGWRQTPPVRMSVLDPGGQDVVDRVEEAFPPPRTRYEKLYLNAADASLNREAIAQTASISYVSDDGHSTATFTIRFDTDVELAGYMVLHLWVEASDANDIDLFVQGQKLDANGNELHVMVRGAPYSGKNGAPYQWGNGSLRVSHRKQDPAKSTHCVPYLTHDEAQLLKPGEILSVDIELPPMAMRWHQGQQLRITVAGHNRQAPEFNFLPQGRTQNRGRTIIHTGGPYDSYLLVPLT